MGNKVLPKKKLDDVIRVLRKKAKTGDDDLYGYALTLAHELPSGEQKWFNYIGVLNAIIGTSGFVPNATNEDIYKVFEAIGFEVQDEQSD